MLNKKMLLPAIAFGIASTFALSGEANAQWGHGFGHGHHGHVGHVQPHVGHVQPIAPSHWGHGQGSYLPSYGWRTPTYHDTTHLDWHGPTIRRHGNHFHLQRGHYDVHRSGHWH